MNWCVKHLFIGQNTQKVSGVSQVGINFIYIPFWYEVIYERLVKYFQQILAKDYPGLRKADIGWQNPSLQSEINQPWLLKILSN